MIVITAYGCRDGLAREDLGVLTEILVARTVPVHIFVIFLPSTLGFALLFGQYKVAPPAIGMGSSSACSIGVIIPLSYGICQLAPYPGAYTHARM